VKPLAPWYTGQDEPDRLLRELLDEALELPEIRDGLTICPELDAGDLRTHALTHGKYVLHQASAAHSRYRQELNSHLTVDWRVGWRNRLPVLYLWLLFGVSPLSALTVPRFSESWVGVAVIVGLAIFNLAAPALHAYRNPCDTFSEDLAESYFSGVGATVLITSLASVGLATRATTESWLSQLPYGLDVGIGITAWILTIITVPVGGGFLASRLGRWLDKRLAVQAGDIKVSEQDVMAAFQEWRRALLEHGVLPFLRDRLNQEQAAQYSVRLRVSEGPAIRNMLRHVETAAAKELVQALKLAVGNSIALVGPRGAGKTNLMEALRDGRYRQPGHAPDLIVKVDAPVKYSSKDFVVYLYSEVCAAVSDYIDAHTRPSPISPLRRLVGRARRGDATPAALRSLAAEARNRRERVRQLRTVTTELGGRFGVPVVGDTAGKRSVAIAGQPMTFPDTVADLVSFLETVAATLRSVAEGQVCGRVLIEIDELDRIGSAEHAREFLNEVKSIFAARSCLFLVSVSEDALRSFGMVALGPRTVFDSAFDEVVRVDYLDFDSAKKLLREHFVGLSEQYLALAYALSGGLARELVRAAATIVTTGKNDAEPTLSSVTPQLAAAELAKSCREARNDVIAADSPGNRKGIGQLIRLLDDHPLGKVDERQLANYARRLRKIDIRKAPQADERREHIAVWADFLAVLVALFNDGLDQREMELLSAEQRVGGQLEALARVHRYVTINPATASDLLADFRSVRHIPSGG
jgi:hypothetical protein